MLLGLWSSIAGAAPCPDNDLDGYANCTVAACDPSGLLCGDCNDADSRIYPGRAEICNQKDDDCDAIADEGSADVSSHAAINDVGAKAFDQAGNSLTGITDITGDGVPDLVVGIQLHDGPTASFNDVGALEIYSGRTRSLRCLMVDPSGVGGDQLGASLAAIPDATGDGIADIAAAAPFDDVGPNANQGSVLLFDGATCAFIRKCVDPSGLANDRLGFGGNPFSIGSNNEYSGGVGSVGDLNGDGKPEIVAGAPFRDGAQADRGQVLVFSSIDCSVLRRLDDTLPSTQAGLGSAVAGIGDVTGDGVPDILAGARNDDTKGTNAGIVIVFSGASGAVVRRVVDPDGAADDALGDALAVLPDITGDGTPDFAAGAPADSVPGKVNVGSVLIFNGATGISLRKLLDPDSVSNDNLGVSIAVGGDITGDGRSELIAGAVFDDTGSITNAGSVLIFSSGDGALIRKLTDPLGTNTDRLGWSVASLGDVSGDGETDWAAGAPGDFSVVQNAGTVHVWSIQADCDGDGRGTFADDCNDADPGVFFGATELCNAKDDDCDGTTDEPGDADSDGITNCSDNCQTLANADQANNDGDAFGNVCDCAPDDATNARRPEVGNSLRLTHAASVTTLTWNDDSIAGPFRSYRGNRTPPNPWGYNQACFGGPIHGTSTTDTASPNAGASLWYVITRSGGCGESVAARDSSGSAIPNQNSCP